MVIKYAEPPEAKIPKKKWRFYPFKGEELLKVNDINFIIVVLVVDQMANSV